MGAEAAAGAFFGREHRLGVRVYYEDTDFTGVVYHAGYMRFFERGRTEFLRACGIEHAALLAGEAPTAFAVTRMEIDWIRPARVDEALTVHTTYDAVKGPRVAIAQRITRDGETLVEAQVEAVCVTPGGRAKKPPRALMEAVRDRLLP